MYIKTTYHNRELAKGTLAKCLNTAKAFYADDLTDSLTIYNPDGTTYAYISRHNQYDSVFIMELK